MTTFATHDSMKLAWQGHAFQRISRAVRLPENPRKKYTSAAAAAAAEAAAAAAAAAGAKKEGKRFLSCVRNVRTQ